MPCSCQNMAPSTYYFLAYWLRFVLFKPKSPTNSPTALRKQSIRTSTHPRRGKVLNIWSPILQHSVSHPTHTPELPISCTQMNTDDPSVCCVLNECKQYSFANLTCRQSHRGNYSSSKRVDLNRKTCEWRNRV